MEELIIRNNMANQFKPRPGQIDYTNARWAPVINCVLKFQDKFLVVQRSEKLNLYPGYWNGISGFLDDEKSLVQKVEEELREELGLSKDKVKDVKLGQIFDQEAPEYNKTWIVHPIFVEVATDEIKLDWEAKKYSWATMMEVKKLKLLPGFDRVIDSLKLWLK